MQWRRQQLQRGGRPVDLDWLLDFAGGVSWSQLQRLRIDPSALFNFSARWNSLLSTGINILKRLFRFSIWWVAAPGVMWSWRCLQRP